MPPLSTCRIAGSMFHCFNDASFAPLPVCKVSLEKSLTPASNTTSKASSCHSLSILHQNIKCWGSMVETWLKTSFASFDLLCFCEHHVHSSQLSGVVKRVARMGWAGVWGAASSSCVGRLRPLISCSASSPPLRRRLRKKTSASTFLFLSLGRRDGDRQDGVETTSYVLSRGADHHLSNRSSHRSGARRLTSHPRSTS